MADGPREEALVAAGLEPPEGRSSLLGGHAQLALPPGLHRLIHEVLVQAPCPLDPGDVAVRQGIARRVRHPAGALEDKG
eukprot:5276986-Lingulodinium_polyedra.AAC.1